MLNLSRLPSRFTLSWLHFALNGSNRRDEHRGEGAGLGPRAKMSHKLQGEICCDRLRISRMVDWGGKKRDSENRRKMAYVRFQREEKRVVFARRFERRGNSDGKEKAGGRGFF